VFIPRLAQMMQHYGSVLLPRGGSALVDMTYYENAVHAMWLASQPQCDHLPSGRAWNITNGEPRTLHSIVQKLIDELGIKCRIRSCPTRCWILSPAAWSILAINPPENPPLPTTASPS
jgi:nucleoside-diphosphate-sugar epimerase